MNSNIFSEELNLIQNKDLREIVKAFIDQAPEYIEHVPASSSGKYHPYFDQGEGGLVRHLKMCVRVAQEISPLKDFEDCDMDVVFSACLIHDLYKNGYTDSGHTVTTHDYICATEFKRFADNMIEEKFKNKSTKIDFTYRNTLLDKIKLIHWAVHAHMGQWSTNVTNSTLPLTTSSLVQWADYISSRKFFDFASEFKVN